jgi:hypothetical protein
MQIQDVTDQGEALIKLPENPADRKKALAAIAVGVMALLYVAFAFGLQPYWASMHARRERVAELENKITRAQKDVDGTNRVNDQNKAIVARILAASEQERHILRPSLGNYLLVASEVINQAAAGLDLTIETINELPRPASPQPKKGGKSTAPANRFSTYTINLSMSGGAYNLARFMQRLETGNPYITVVRLIVMAQSDKTPERHFISLHLQWPIWQDEEHPQRLQAEQIADEERQ